MNLFERLPKEDVRLMKTYLDWYGDYEDSRPAIALDHMDYFLRFWNVNKVPLYKMFGEQFILKKEVQFSKSVESMMRDLESQLFYNCKNAKAETFRKNYVNYVNCHFGDWDERERLWSFVDNSRTLAINRWDGEDFIVPAAATITGREIQVSTNCKVIKMLGKLADAFGVSEGYEEYRQIHSQILNQKRIKGTLCLSIHPMDYITMSDNDCGWDSCMKWVDEAGDYRIGTIEMMNSPCVVVAYLESDTPMHVCDRLWNSKKWRQLYIVNEDIILGNRQYPYVNAELQGVAINWLRDLAMADSTFGPYEDNTTEVHNKETNTICGGSRVYFNIHTSMMYNDVYDGRLAYLNPRIAKYNTYDLNFSGPAVCTACGKEIEPDEVETYIVRCMDCDGCWRCANCGNRHYDDNYYEVNNCRYCDWCYHHELESCEICGKKVIDANRITLYLPCSENDKTNFLGDRYYICMCDDCFDKPEEYEKHFGPMVEIKSYYGGYSKYGFMLKNISNKGLRPGDLNEYTINRLKRLRDCKNPAEYYDIWNSGY